ncbi:MAG: hypothetical protein ACRDFB_09110, partial [Rhabdochlamydiaceae bacterium]
MFRDTYDKLIEKLTIKYKKRLISTRFIQKRLKEKDIHLTRLAAENAFRDTPLAVGDRWNGWGFYDTNYMPEQLEHYIDMLKNETFAGATVKNFNQAQLHEIQDKFLHGYK